MTLPTVVPFGQLLDDFDGAYSHQRKYYRRPHMIRVKNPVWAFLLFPSGKYRLMLKNESTQPGPILNFIYQVLTDNKNAVIPNNFKIQSETFCLSLPFRINLQLYKESRNNDIEIQYEPELFPALRFNWYPPILINMFHTGKVIIMGRKSRRHLDVISQRLHSLDKKFTY